MNEEEPSIKVSEFELIKQVYLEIQNIFKILHALSLDCENKKVTEVVEKILVSRQEDFDKWIASNLKEQMVKSLEDKK